MIFIKNKTKKTKKTKKKHLFQTIFYPSLKSGKLNATLFY